MDNEEVLNLAKEAYALSQQLHELESAMSKDGAVSGYTSYATNYNSILSRAKKILEFDKTLLATISYLGQYDPNVKTGYFKEFQEIKANIAILKATLHTFFNFNFPKKERDRIGFKVGE